MLRAFNEELLAVLSRNRDPIAEAAAHARAVALMKEVGAAVFEHKLIAYPLIIHDVEVAELARAAGLLLAAQVKLLEHLRATRSDAAVLEMFRIPPHLLPFMRWENLARPEETVGRLDIIPTRHGYSFCELNIIPAVGGGEAHPCGEMYFHTLGFPDTARPPGPLQLLAAHYAQLARQRGFVRVVILDSVEHGRHGYPRQLLLQRYLRAAVPGLAVELCDEESYPASWLSPAEGARTLVHRMFTHEEVTDGFAFLTRLWQSGATLAGFESDLRMSKRFLVLMCDPAYRHLLSEEELAAIDRFVPHSYALTEDNVAAALADRAALVFKWDDSASYGGSGVLVGAEHEAGELERKLREHGVERWICQRALEAEELPLRTGDDAEPLPYRVVLGLYWYGGVTSGMMLRASRASRVVNASSPTGRIGWAYPVSAEGRQALIRHARERQEMSESEAAPLELRRTSAGEPAGRRDGAPTSERDKE